MSSLTAITYEQMEKSAAWARAYYAACDSLGVPSWITKFYDSESAGQVGNLPSMKGHEAFTIFFENTFKSFSSKKHTVKHVDVLPNRLYAQVDLTVLIKNDPDEKPITIEALVVWEKKVDEDKATGVHVYADRSPIVERIKMCTSAAS